MEEFKNLDEEIIETESNTADVIENEDFYDEVEGEIMVPQEEETNHRSCGTVALAILACASVGGAIAWGAKKLTPKIRRKINERRIRKLEKLGYEVFPPEEVIDLEPFEEEVSEVVED